MRRFLAATIAVLVLGEGIASADVGLETAKLLANDGLAGDEFGYSVALSGSTAVVGARKDDDKGTSSGSAYLFDVTTKQQLFKLVAEDGVSIAEFGNAVGISGTTAIVGAYHDNARGTDAGAAYLFDTTTGQQIAKLLANDETAFDNFGFSVAISATHAVVGAWFADDGAFDSGSAYVFDATTGNQIGKLSPSDPQFMGYYGYSVGISGTTALVGAINTSNSGAGSGSAYLFDTTTGLQTAVLLPNDGAQGDGFGNAVAISGTTAVVGATGRSDNGTSSGAVYLFDTTTGLQTAKLLPTDGAAFDFFGAGVGLSGTTVVVSANGDDNNGSASGSFYLFDAVTGLQLANLLPSDGVTGDSFGISVAVSGTTALIGAYLNDALGADAGAAYVFDTDSCSEPASTTVRNGSGLNASIFTRVSDPVVAGDWVTDLDCSGHSPGLAAVVAYEGPSAGFFLTGGELLIDLSSAFATGAVLVHAGGVEQFSIAVPNDLAFCGFSVSSQGVVMGSPGYELSNALDLVVGF